MNSVNILSFHRTFQFFHTLQINLHYGDLSQMIYDPTMLDKTKDSQSWEGYIIGSYCNLEESIHQFILMNSIWRKFLIQYKNGCTIFLNYWAMKSYQNQLKSRWFEYSQRNLKVGQEIIVSASWIFLQRRYKYFNVEITSAMRKSWTKPIWNIHSCFNSLGSVQSSNFSFAMQWFGAVFYIHSDIDNKSNNHKTLSRFKVIYQSLLWISISLLITVGFG